MTYERLDAIERNNVLGMPLVYVRGYVREFAREVGLDPDDVTQRYIAQFETTTAPPAASEPIDPDIPTPSNPETTPDNRPRDVELNRSHGVELNRSHEADLNRPHESEAPRRSAWGPRSAQWAVLVLVAVVATQVGFMFGWSRARHASPGTVDARSTVAPVDAERSAAPTKPDPDAARVSDVPPTTSSATEPAADLTGGWTMTNEVQTSGVRTFQGLKLVYELELQQDGVNVSGTGRKISENGRVLQGAARTPITFSGTVDGDRVHLTFREKGRRRESGGSFEFQRANDGSLRGTFESDAARSRGQSIVQRALP